MHVPPTAKMWECVGGSLKEEKVLNSSQAGRKEGDHLPVDQEGESAGEKSSSSSFPVQRIDTVNASVCVR